MPRQEPGWEEFENSVSMIFAAAGFSVRRHVQLNGYEFDIIAERNLFAGFELRIAVECKYRAERQVGNTDIHAFVAAMKAAESHRFTNGVVVTNQRFSRGAHEAAAAYPMIRLLTISALEDEIVGTRLYLQGASRGYRSDGHDKYIDLSATKHPINQWSEATPVASVVDYCVDAFTSSDQQFVFLLGDFGSGKTTVAERVHSVLAKAFLEGDDASSEKLVFPVILYLRTLQAFETEDAFIEDQVRRSASELNINMITRLEGRRPLLFILDGFDEVATNALKEERMHLLSRVMRLAGRASHLLITSRPSYFTNIEGINQLVAELTERDFIQPARFGRKPLISDSRIEEKMALSRSAASGASRKDGYRPFPQHATSILYLQPLSQADIIAYLTPESETLAEIYKKDVAEVVSILNGIYDLSDLMSRPLMLGFLEAILLKGKLDLNDPNLDIGPAGLYQIYINLSLDREWEKRQFLTREERLAFARAAAVVMLEAGGSLQASYNSIERIVRAGGETFAALQRDELLRQMSRVIADVQLCSFINVTVEDRIEFTHKSFMEFFIADIIMQMLPAKRAISYLRQNLNWEILYFMGSHSLVRDRYFFDLIEHLRDFGASEGERYRTNLRIALLLAHPISEGAIFGDIRFDVIRIVRKRFKDCSFSDFHLTGAQIAATSFEQCRFTATTLRGDFEEVSFRECAGRLLVAETLVAVDLIANRDLVITSARDTMRFERGVWESGRIVIDHKLVEAEALSLKGCTLELKPGSEWRFDGCVFDDVRIDMPEPAMLILDRCRLGKMHFRKAIIAPSSYFDHRDQFGDCSGVLFIADRSRGSGDLYVSRDKGPVYRGWRIRGALLVMTDEFLSTYEAHGPKIQEMMAEPDAEVQFAAWAQKHLHLPDRPTDYVQQRSRP